MLGTSAIIILSLIGLYVLAESAYLSIVLIKYFEIDFISVVSKNLSYKETMELALQKMVEKGTLLNYNAIRLLEDFGKEKILDETKIVQMRSMMQFQLPCFEELPKKGQLPFFLSLGLLLGKFYSLANLFPAGVKKDQRYSKLVKECALFTKLSNILLRILRILSER